MKEVSHLPHVRVLKHHLPVQYLVLGALEVLLLTVAALISLVVLSGLDHIQNLFENSLLLKALVFAVVMSGCSLAMGIYAAYPQEGFLSMFLRTLVSFCLLGMAALSVFYYVFPNLFIAKSVLFWTVMASVAIVVVARWSFSCLVDVAQLKARVVVYGAGWQASRILENFSTEQGSFGVRILGCVAAKNDSIAVTPDQAISYPDNWLEFVSKNHVSEIVVALDERRRSKGGVFPLEDLLDCKLDGVKVVDAITFYERELRKIEIEMLNPSWMLFADGFRHSQLRDFSKRVFDLLVCAVLLTFTWPLMLLTALAVLLETGWPLIYSQNRQGLNGRVFRIYKFRSMAKDAEKGGKALWAQKNDPRITKVGAFIRNARLDELPQLFNVLKGQMSFVGPRPERPEFVTRLREEIPYYNTRHRVKPGLIGWAQLKYPYGASVADARNKLRYDLYYVKNHSIFMDILIMMQTIEIVLLGKGVR